ncbi:hypothetical protein I7G59_06390 [Sinorhizobium meliloti]|uniref:hypothetical protein n=1 Tax=Rhizobium meliloti TaxID=382 RepID=UPI00237FF6D6|nr:hypothetical protein [Sinorhizobium meliloti]MDE3796962.1 hypothetical protein [Sinorhizobium meliloti]
MIDRLEAGHDFQAIAVIEHGIANAFYAHIVSSVSLATVVYHRALVAHGGVVVVTEDCI